MRKLRTDDPGPFYPGCKHPLVDLDRDQCLYCGKELNKKEVNDRIAEGWSVDQV